MEENAPSSSTTTATVARGSPPTCMMDVRPASRENPRAVGVTGDTGEPVIVRCWLDLPVCSLVKSAVKSHQSCRPRRPPTNGASVRTPSDTVYLCVPQCLWCPVANNRPSIPGFPSFNPFACPVPGLLLNYAHCGAVVCDGHLTLCTND